MSEKLEKSKTEGAHHIINSLVGEWEGTTKTWFEPDKLADESPMQGKIKSLLDGRFVMHEYRGSLEGKPFEGIAIYGYSFEWERFQCAWIDSFHMGSSIMLAEGKNIDKGFSVSGTYGSIKLGQQWGWRTLLEVISEDQIIITAYNISPEGEEAKALETIYRRKRTPILSFK